MPFPSISNAQGVWKLGEIPDYTNSSNYRWANTSIIEVYIWGAGGGGATPGGWSFGAAGGAGGAAVAYLSPPSQTVTYHVTVGQAGLINQYEYREGGGGISTRHGVAFVSIAGSNSYSGGGGGYSGLFSSSTKTQQTALIIAGGGGGGGSSRAGTGNTGGGGGGLVGENGSSPYDNKPLYAGLGGTQIAAGANPLCDSPQDTNGFQGALQGGSCLVNSNGGGGGGGYWGGSAGGYSESNTMGGGGGGSGYIKPSTFIGATLYRASGTSAGNAGGSGRGSAGNSGNASSNGSDGLVYFKYRGTPRAVGGTISQTGGYTYHTFTVSSTITFYSAPL
jgi:hypothetical protein